VDRETKELLKRADQNLIALLRAGLDLGFTFARTAGIEAGEQNAKDFQRALESVRMSLAAVRRFESKILDLDAGRDLKERAAELEILILTLGPALRSDLPLATTKKCKKCGKPISVHRGTTNESRENPGYCYECGKLLDQKSK